MGHEVDGAQHPARLRGSRYQRLPARVALSGRDQSCRPHDVPPVDSRAERLAALRKLHVHMVAVLSLAGLSYCSTVAWCNGLCCIYI